MPENTVWKCIGSQRPVKLLVGERVDDEELYVVHIITDDKDDLERKSESFYTYLRESDRVDSVDRVRGDTMWANDETRSDIARMIESLKDMMATV